MSTPGDEEGRSETVSDESPQVARRESGRRRPRGYGLVLLALLIAVAIASVGQSNALTQTVSLIVISAALLLALRTAQVAPRTQRRAAALITLALAVGVLSIFPAATFVPNSLLTVIDALLIAATSVVLSRRLVQNPEVTRQTIIGALCVYLLIGLFFVFVFSGSTLVTGQPFFTSTPDASTSDYIYFSFITLSTVGYGDFVPRSNLGRMLAATEGLTGQLYLVTIVALLVSNLKRPGRDSGD